MKITILALGSRGDVQPFVALGRELQALGHVVSIAAARDYEQLVEHAGITFAPIVGTISEIMDFELVYQALDAAEHPLPLGFARRFLEHVEPLVVRIVADCFQAAQGADALVVSSLGRYPGLSIAEALGIPLIPAHMHPFTPTRAFPDLSFPTLFSGLPFAHLYNLLTHTLGTHAMWQLLRRGLNRARQTLLGLPALGPRALWQRAQGGSPLVLYGFSPLVAPKPADWDAHQHVTGYWLLDRPAAWQPPEPLLAFLQAGPPPVYIGFGSILAGRNPDAVTRLLVEALTMSGQRGILFRGWGDLGNIKLPAHIYATDSVPHDWLFPHVAAVVTHGGAGTTAAALRAGAPPIVVPFFGDQRFWAERVVHLGVGPAAIPRGELTAKRLAAAIKQTVHDQPMRARAKTLGNALENEHGAANAARLFSPIER